MAAIPDFPLETPGPVTKAFQMLGINHFSTAAAYIQQLPYRRNTDKNNLLSVLQEQCGTCSTKHALLKMLTEEQQQHGFRLMSGLFRMNALNTRPAAPVLQQYGLGYIPEAHCYLRYGEEVLDYTKTGSTASQWLPDLIRETEISPDQISAFKVAWQKDYIREWLAKQPEIHLGPEDIWTAREACIAALTGEY